MDRNSTGLPSADSRAYHDGPLQQQQRQFHRELDVTCVFGQLPVAGALGKRQLEHHPGRHGNQPLDQEQTQRQLAVPGPGVQQQRLWELVRNAHGAGHAGDPDDGADIVRAFAGQRLGERLHRLDGGHACQRVPSGAEPGRRQLVADRGGFQCGDVHPGPGVRIRRSLLVPGTGVQLPGLRAVLRAGNDDRAGLLDGLYRAVGGEGERHEEGADAAWDGVGAGAVARGPRATRCEVPAHGCVGERRSRD